MRRGGRCGGAGHKRSLGGFVVHSIDATAEVLMPVPGAQARHHGREQGQIVGPSRKPRFRAVEVTHIPAQLSCHHRGLDRVRGIEGAIRAVVPRSCCLIAGEGGLGGLVLGQHRRELLGGDAAGHRLDSGCLEPSQRMTAEFRDVTVLRPSHAAEAGTIVSAPAPVADAWLSAILSAVAASSRVAIGTLTAAARSSRRRLFIRCHSASGMFRSSSGSPSHSAWFSSRARLEVAQGGLGRNRAGVYRVVCTHDLVLLLGEWAIGAVGGHRRRRHFSP